jgi:hypothetical protein
LVGRPAHLQCLVVVGSNNDVHELDGTAKAWWLFGRKLQLKKSTVDLVDHENGLDTFGDSLTKTVSVWTQTHQWYQQQPRHHR